MTDFGPIDPNSQHQMWSRWIFGIVADRYKRPSRREVLINATIYFKKLFKSSVGRVRCDHTNRKLRYYLVTVEIEGPPVHDSEYVQQVKQDFIDRFVYKGFGASARLVRFEAILLAGNAEQGKPPDQMLVMPQILPTSKLFTS